jgi:hypothetical protein
MEDQVVSSGVVDAKIQITSIKSLFWFLLWLDYRNARRITTVVWHPSHVFI